MSSGEPPASRAARTAAKAIAFNRRLVLLVLASFLAFVVSIILEVGIGATPFDTTDSLGRPMGFNDPLHGEHFLILWRNTHFAALLRPAHAYTWLLGAMHITGAWLLLSSAQRSGRLTRCFFAAQAFIFPFGLVFCWIAPVILTNLCVGNLGDREGLTDFPVGMSVNAAAVLSKVMLFALNTAFTFGAGSTAPAKMRSVLRRSLTGAVLSSQLRPVEKLLSAPPPSQVSVTANAGSSTRSEAMVVARMRDVFMPGVVFSFQTEFAGILADGRVDVLNNNCTGQFATGAAGIRVIGSGGCRIEVNNVSLNAAGVDVVSVRNVIFRNVAWANGTDFAIAPANTHGPIINAIGFGDISLAPGASHPTANFRD